MLTSRPFFACAKLGALATLLKYAYSTARNPRDFIGATTPSVLLTTLTTTRFDLSISLEGCNISTQPWWFSTRRSSTSSYSTTSKGPEPLEEWDSIPGVVRYGDLVSKGHQGINRERATVRNTDILLRAETGFGYGWQVTKCPGGYGGLVTSGGESLLNGPRLLMGS